LSWDITKAHVLTKYIKDAVDRYQSKELLLGQAINYLVVQANNHGIRLKNREAATMLKAWLNFDVE